MEIRINFKKAGINKSFKIVDSIANTKKVLHYQDDIYNIYDIDSSNPSAYTNSQIKAINRMIDFLVDIFDITEDDAKKLEEKSYEDVAEVAGMTCNKVLHIEEDNATDVEDPDTKK